MQIKGRRIALLSAAAVPVMVIALTGAMAFFSDAVEKENRAEAALISIEREFDPLTLTPSADTGDMDMHFGSWRRGDTLTGTLRIKLDGNAPVYLTPKAVICGSDGNDYTDCFTGRVMFINTGTETGETLSAAESEFGEGSCTPFSAEPGIAEVRFGLELTDDLPEGVFPVPEFRAYIVQQYGNDIADISGDTGNGFAAVIENDELFDTEGADYSDSCGLSAYREAVFSFTAVPDDVSTGTEIKAFEASDEDISVYSGTYKMLDISEKSPFFEAHCSDETEYELPFVIRKGTEKRAAVTASNETAGRRTVIVKISCDDDGNITFDTEEAGTKV